MSVVFHRICCAITVLDEDEDERDDVDVEQEEVDDEGVNLDADGEDEHGEDGVEVPVPELLMIAAPLPLACCPKTAETVRGRNSCFILIIFLY